MSLLTRWQPFQEVQVLRQQFDRLFDDLIQTDPKAGTLLKGNFPAIEIQETDQNLVIKIEVPGMRAADLDIQLSADRLEISGEHSEESSSDTAATFHSELHYGKFRRVIALPATVQHEAAAATFENGMVRLVLPKLAQQQRSVVKVDITEQPTEASAQKAKGKPDPQEKSNHRVADPVGAGSQH
jgi:HSP20 family protein